MKASTVENQPGASRRSRPGREADLRLFGLAESAGRAEIDRAWRRLARRLHPDHNRGREEAAAQLFSRAAEARHRLLGDFESSNPAFVRVKSPKPAASRPSRQEPRRWMGVLILVVTIALTIRWAPGAADAVRLQSADAAVEGSGALLTPYELALAAGDSQLEVGRLDEARRQYGFALRDFPGRPDVYERLARLAEVREDPAAAEAWRRAAVRANPYHPDPRARLARFYFLRGRWGDAALEGWRAVSRSLHGPS